MKNRELKFVGWINECGFIVLFIFYYIIWLYFYFGYVCKVFIRFRGLYMICFIYLFLLGYNFLLEFIVFCMFSYYLYLFCIRDV